MKAFIVAAICLALGGVGCGGFFLWTLSNAVMPPVINSPSEATWDDTPNIAGIGSTLGDTITVTDTKGQIVCVTMVRGDLSWTCTPEIPLPEGEAIIMATEDDLEGRTSKPSAPFVVRVELVSIQEKQERWLNGYQPQAWDDYPPGFEGWGTAAQCRFQVKYYPNTMDGFCGPFTRDEVEEGYCDDFCQALVGKNRNENCDRFPIPINESEECL